MYAIRSYYDFRIHVSDCGPQFLLPEGRNPGSAQIKSREAPSSCLSALNSPFSDIMPQIGQKRSDKVIVVQHQTVASDIQKQGHMSGRVLTTLLAGIEQNLGRHRQIAQA